MPARLRKLKITAVALVDRGANQLADVLLYKRAVQLVEPLTPFLDAFIDKAGRVIAGARLERLKQAVLVLQRICEEAEPEPVPIKHDPLILDKGAHDMAELDDLTKRATDAEAVSASLQAQIVTLEKRATEAEAEVVKLRPTDPWQGVSVEVRKRIEDGEVRVAKAEAEVRKRDCIGQVKKYDKLPINPDEHWAMFDALNGLSDDVRKQVFTVFDSAQEVARVSGVLKKQGRVSNDTDGPDTTVVAEAERLAKAYQAAHEGSTYPDAMTAVMRDTDLYNRYRAETAARV